MTDILLFLQLIKMISILKFILFNVLLGLLDMSTDLATFFTLMEDHHPLWAALTGSWMLTSFLVHAAYFTFRCQINLSYPFIFCHRISRDKWLKGTTGYNSYGDLAICGTVCQCWEVALAIMITPASNGVAIAFQQDGVASSCSDLHIGGTVCQCWDVALAIIIIPACNGGAVTFQQDRVSSSCSALRSHVGCHVGWRCNRYGAENRRRVWSSSGCGFGSLVWRGSGCGFGSRRRWWWT